MRCFFPLLLFCGSSIGWAQSTFEPWPAIRYDESVPSFESVLGHAAGERILSHAEMLELLRALETALPDQIRLFEYARSWEGRPLVYAVIGSRENVARLDEIRRNRARLADPRATPEEDAVALVASEPAITWLAYGVHGNEISSPDASLLTAYHLLAARGDEVVETILAESLVVIVPTQNPDGRDRFVHHFRAEKGLEPRAHPAAAEHDEPWPGGRTNHYYFDLNRDWLALTQPETRGHVAAYQEWFPQVFVDLHEMGGNSTYYFTPEAVPFNPHITERQRETLDLYGRNNAKWFDELGFLYFTREVYDAFYPGYGASWPLFHGSIAATYEQASARGLVFQRSDGTELLFRDGVRHHFVASISTAETTARHRRELLQAFWDYRRSAIEEGRTEPVKAYALVSRGDAAAARKLAGLLVEHGVEVGRARAAFRGCGRELPLGSFLVDLAQPAKRLARTILDPDVPLEADFIREQERRRRKDLPDEIYDVTGWSLPHMFDVEAIPCESVPSAELEPVPPTRKDPGRLSGGRAEVAYLAPWGSAATARLLAKALRRELRVLSSDREIHQDGRVYPAGTLVFPVSQNPASLHEELSGLARETGAEVWATSTGWVEGGVNFGSRNVHHVRKPAIALAWDEPTSPNAAGATRFVLERQYGYPVTPIRTRRLLETDLRPFDVLILPDGDYDGELDETAAERLNDWVRGGGTLIGLAGAVDTLAERGLLSTKREHRPPPATDGDGDAEGGGPRLLDSEEDYLEAIEPEEELPDPVAGVLLRARLDPDHWLTAGLGESVQALVSGRSIFEPLRLDEGQNPAVFASADELLVSGHLWEENRRQLAFKPLVMVQEEGSGLVIGFTADPNFRAYLDGMNGLFLSAIFRGPARARPTVPLGSP